MRLVILVCLGAALVAPPLQAQVPSADAAAAAAPVTPGLFEGPPAPVPPSVISRDGEGGVTVRAVRLTQPLRIDGALDEALYREVPAMSDFVQVEPLAGEPATEKTETWVAFDEENVYVSFRNWDTQMDRLIATEMRRDSTIPWQGNDIVSFMFDTFFDKRNSIAFTVNPIGARSDGQVLNDRQYSSDWNAVWEFKTGRFDGGWTLETRIPFKSIRYQTGSAQLWGFNAMRVKRSKNEVSTLKLVPQSRGQLGVQAASLAATMVGLEAPSSGRVIDFKPYVTGNLTSNRLARPAVSNDFGRDAGFDLKYAVTANMTADATVRTDFAQVEADEQQINLTRFSLFFPEKREFFLENQGTFAFGGVPLGGFSTAGNAPLLFYSRQIGLQSGRAVPLDVGGRLTGRAGRYTVGLINIQTGDEDVARAEPTNFSVVRVKRDLMRKSSVGVIFTNRSVALRGEPGASNQAYGFDGTFAFYDNVFFNAYWARTETDGRSGDPDSYRGQFEYAADRYGVQLERLKIGNDFNPEVGFVLRTDMVLDRASFRFSPRPKRRGAIRRYVYQGSLEYVENGQGQLESRDRQGEFAIEFQNADRVGVQYSNSFEFLPVPFPIAAGIELPVGARYSFDTVTLRYNMGQQRTLSANLSAEFGSFYSGRKTTFSAARGRAIITNQLSAEPVYSLNRVELDEGRFTTHLLGSRLVYTMTPWMFVSALIQYNSGSNAVSTNARLRWEYSPGSELFVVYNEERNTLARAFPTMQNRALIVKVNKLLRF
jgi:hypothetical protein